MGRPSSIKIVRLAAIWNFFGAAMENCKNGVFLLKTLLLDIFWWENFSRIGPWESSGPEVSENVVLLGRTIFLTGVIAAQSQHRAAKVCLSRKISDVKKKRHGHNFEFSEPALNQARKKWVSQALIQWRVRKIKIVAVSFFDIFFVCRKKLKNDLTLTANNSPLKSRTHKKYHILESWGRALSHGGTLDMV